MPIITIGRVETVDDGRRLLEVTQVSEEDARGMDATADQDQVFEVRKELDGEGRGDFGPQIISGDALLRVFPQAESLGHLMAAHQEERYLALPEGSAEIHFLTHDVTRRNGNHHIEGIRLSVKRLRWEARPDDAEEYIDGDGDVFAAEDEEDAEDCVQERSAHFLGMLQDLDDTIDERIIILRREHGAIHVTVDRHRFERMNEALREIVRAFRCVFVFDALAFTVSAQRNVAVCSSGQEAVELLKRVARHGFAGVAIDMTAAAFERVRRNLLRHITERDRVWREPRGTAGEPLALAATVIENEMAIGLGTQDDEEEEEDENENDDAAQLQVVQLPDDGVFHASSVCVTVRRNGVRLSVTLSETIAGDQIRVAEDTWSPISATMTRQAANNMMQIRPRLLAPNGAHTTEASDRLGGLTVELKDGSAELALANPPVSVGDTENIEVHGIVRAGSVMVRCSATAEDGIRCRRVQQTLQFNVDGGQVRQEDARARAIAIANATPNVFVPERQPPGQAVTLVNRVGGVVHRVPYGTAAFSQNGATLHETRDELLAAINEIRIFTHVSAYLQSAELFATCIRERTERFDRYGRVHRARLPDGDAAVAAMPHGTTTPSWGDHRIHSNLEPGLPTISSLASTRIDLTNETAQRVHDFLRRLPAHVAQNLMWATGLWAGDGTRNAMTFAIGDDEAARLLPMLHSLGDLRAHARQNADAVQVHRLAQPNLLQPLLQLLGVYEEKYFSFDAIETIKTMDVRLRKAFLSGCIDADGSKSSVSEFDIIVFGQSFNEDTPAWSHDSIASAFAVVSQSLGFEVSFGEVWTVDAPPIYDRELGAHNYELGQAERRAARNGARVRRGVVLIRGSLSDLPIQVPGKRVLEDKFYLEHGDITSSSGFFVAETRAPRRDERVTCVIVENSSGFFDDNGYWCQTVGEIPWNDPTDADAPYPFGWLRRDAVASEVARAARRVMHID